jgi:hypothetical protein
MGRPSCSSRIVGTTKDLKSTPPELFSFVKNELISVEKAFGQDEFT